MWQVLVAIGWACWYLLALFALWAIHAELKRIADWLDTAETRRNRTDLLRTLMNRS